MVFDRAPIDFDVEQIWYRTGSGSDRMLHSTASSQFILELLKGMHRMTTFVRRLTEQSGAIPSLRLRVP